MVIHNLSSAFKHYKLPTQLNSLPPPKISRLYCTALINTHNLSEDHSGQLWNWTIRNNRSKDVKYPKHQNWIGMHSPKFYLHTGYITQINTPKLLNTHTILKTSTCFTAPTQYSIGSYRKYHGLPRTLQITSLRESSKSTRFREYLDYKLWLAACAGIIFITYELDQSHQTPLDQAKLFLVTKFTDFFLAYRQYFKTCQPLLNFPRFTVKCEQQLKFNLEHQPSEPKSFYGKINNIHISASQAAANSPIEDRFSISSEKINNKEVIFATVIDGHSGFVAAEYICENINKYLINAYKDTYFKFSEGLVHYFKELDKALEKYLVENTSNPAKGGACSLAMIIDDEFITVANTGDCMAVLSRKSGAIQMNTVHNANDPIERQKIIDSHSNEQDAVYCKRSWKVKKAPTTAYEHTLNMLGMAQTITHYKGCYVKSALNPTRSFGDFMLKDEKYAYDKKRDRYRISKPFSFPYITAEPEVTTFKRSDEDEFIIIASDGVWDFFDADELTNLIKEEIKISIQAASEKIIKAVYEKACKHSGLTLNELSSHPHKRSFIDDLTVIVIDLSNKKF